MKNAPKPKVPRLPYQVQAIKYVARQLKVNARQAVEWLKRHVDDQVRL